MRDEPAGWLVPVAGGVAGGLIAGLFGVGGGVVLVPILIFALHRTQHAAHATSLVGVAIGSAAAVSRFAFDDAVAWAGALALAVGAITGARLGTRLMPRIREVALRRAFALLLIVLAVRFLIVGDAQPTATASTIADLDVVRVTLHAIAGLGAGLTSALLGVGGGVILVPVLVLAFGYPQHLAEGTSLAVIVPTAITGAIGHSKRGYTDWRLGATLGVGALVGGLLGAQLALTLPAETLARLFGVLQLVVGVLTLRRRPSPEVGDVNVT